jgi:hypothetical protein
MIIVSYHCKLKKILSSPFEVANPENYPDIESHKFHITTKDGA